MGKKIEIPAKRYLESSGASASDYGKSYEKVGFEPVYTHDRSSKVLQPKNIEYKKGDIIVFQPAQGRNTYHKHGHIAMFNGTNWISDFVQRNKHGIIWGDVDDKDLEFTIYRRPSWQDWD